MKNLLPVLIILTSSGCVDLGRVGMHPELKTAYFDGRQHEVINCLYSAALNQHLSLMRGDPYPDGSERYNLQDANFEDVAWIDVSTFSNKQTSVNFFYAPHAPDVTAAISAMVSQCKK
ncbi:hypothetical protein [Rahnella sikkimica]|uniref:Uncharacterized protein n=1 Tax=Rahnella sikkimica TaxID=1805933 RepID=A0A2L1UXF2_9GAMM|nr:hypothetical protein [Rahnella sikkimica]AVF37629.1 hypothetical protein BV494_22145 [Rahnella sikkimica]